MYAFCAGENPIISKSRLYDIFIYIKANYAEKGAFAKGLLAFFEKRRKRLYFFAS
jgi:hypothetical protein